MDQFVLHDSDVRQVLADEFYNASDEDLDDALGPELIDAVEQLQELSLDMRRIGRSLSKALPGALRGALAGASVGGGPGAIVGGIAGGAGALLGGGSTAGSAATSKGSKQPGKSATAGTAKQQPSKTAGQPVPNTAAAQLLSVLLRPEVFRAIAAMALGSKGAATVEAGGTAVPVTAIANMLQQLSTRAAAEHHANVPIADEVPAYLLEGDVDAYSPDGPFADESLGVEGFEGHYDEPDGWDVSAETRAQRVFDRLTEQAILEAHVLDRAATLESHDDFEYVDDDEDLNDEDDLVDVVTEDDGVEYADYYEYGFDEDDDDLDDFDDFEDDFAEDGDYGDYGERFSDVADDHGPREW